jgi:hypothetical protein
MSNTLPLQVLAILLSVLFLLLCLWPELFKKYYPEKWRLIGNISLGLILILICFRTKGWGDFGIYFLFSGPGIIFSIAVAAALRKKSLVRKLSFFVLSSLLYYSMVCLASTNWYFRPDQKFMILASVTGAIIETILFVSIFKFLRNISIIHIIIIITTGLISFLPYGLLGIFLWQAGIGLTFHILKERESNQIIHAQN